MTLKIKIIQNKLKKNKIPGIITASFCLGILCLVVSVLLCIGLAASRLGPSSILIAFFVIMPMLAISPIGIGLSIKALIDIKKKYQVSETKKMYTMATIGLVGSLSFFVAIPISASLQDNLEKQFYEEQSEQKSAEEAEAIAYATEPSIINQIQHYDSCYSYKEGENYRAGRDVICSYLRYMYSNNWQELENGEQLSSEKYTPNYLSNSFVSIEKNISNVSRGLLYDGSNTKYLITPHSSCQKETNDSVISVWYLDGGIYDDKEEQLVCMYYDYHSDTTYVQLNKYEDTSFNIYSSEFKDLYEELLSVLYKRSSNVNADYTFTVPFRGNTYDNAAFMNDFFSGVTEELSL